MPLSSADKRKLIYPLTYSLENVGDSPDEPPPDDPQIIWAVEDEYEQIDIVLHLSLNEYVALATAVDVGRDIAFTTDSEWVWWIWNRAFRGIPTMTCEQIIDCIENDSDTGLALQQWLSDNGYGGGTGTGTPGNAGIYQQNPLVIDGSTIEDCNNDNLFGAITQFVDFINRRIVDVFEIIESETNIIERSQIALEAFPITDTLAADSAAAFADQLAEEIAEGYDAAFTEELEDEYRCDLFCLVKDTCELDFQTFADYFNDRIGNTPPDVQFSEYIEWFITGDFVGSNIVDAAYSLVCSALAYGADAFGINIGALLTSVNSALNDPNSDWLTLCDDCGGDFPDLITTRCQDALNLGMVTQIDANHWHCVSEVHSDSNSYLFLRDSAINPANTFKILEITNIVHASGSENGSQTSGSCSQNNVFSWIPGQIGALNRYEYMFSSNVAFSFDIEVSEIGA